MDRCDNCKFILPGVIPVVMFDTGVRICHVCALSFRNTREGLPKLTPFDDPKMHAAFCRAVHFLGNDAPSWATVLANGETGVVPFDVNQGIPRTKLPDPRDR